MRPSQHTENEILRLLIEADAGLPVDELCRRARISERTFYRWRRRFGGVTPKATVEVKNLQLENMRLRSMLTRLAIEDGGRVAKAFAVPVTVPMRRDIGRDSPQAGASLGRFAAVRGAR